MSKSLILNLCIQCEGPWADTITRGECISVCTQSELWDTQKLWFHRASHEQLSFYIIKLVLSLVLLAHAGIHCRSDLPTARLCFARSLGLAVCRNQALPGGNARPSETVTSDRYVGLIQSAVRHLSTWRQLCCFSGCLRSVLLLWFGRYDFLSDPSSSKWCKIQQHDNVDWGGMGACCHVLKIPRATILLHYVYVSYAYEMRIIWVFE